MNRKEWKEFCKTNKEGFYWYNKVKKKLLLKEFESLEICDVDAKVIHHLQDTEEQRAYNDAHYELFGFEVDENGNEIFNYGKYVVFWTKEHHNDYHHGSEITRKKRAMSLKGKHHTEEAKQKCRESKLGEKNPMYGKKGELCPNFGRRGELNKNYGKHLSEETRKKISDAQKGEKSWCYGRHLSEEQKKQISEFHKGRKRPKETGERISKALKNHYDKNGVTDETKEKISRSLTKYFSEHGISEETRKRLSEAQKRRPAASSETREKLSKSRSAFLKPITEAYKKYKQEGGHLTWNEFVAEFSKNKNVNDMLSCDEAYGLS